MTSASLLALSASAAAQDAPAAFLAGIGVRDITPEPGVRMWGYANRANPASGTLDPLLTKALVIRTGDMTLAIVTMDLGRVPIEPVCNRIRAHAKKAGVDHVTFIASHTHGGPVMEYDDMPHIKRIEAGIIAAIDEAIKKLVPARIGSGSTTIDISHNRRVIRDGQCYMLWRNEKKVPTDPIDHEATLIRIDAESGAPLAVLVHYACHPVVLGHDNEQYTGDWVGEMARQVGAKTGAECLFLQGAAGDINPYLDKTPLPMGGIESMRNVGQEAAEAVLRGYASIKTETPTDPSLGVSDQFVRIGTRWDFSEKSQQDIFRSVYGPVFESYIAILTRELSVPLSVVVINKDIALAFMPGELFVQYQIDMKLRSVLPKTLLCGYANDFHLYFPTLQGAAAGGYGGIVATYVGNGAGDRLVDEALIDIGNLSGKIKNELQMSDFELKEA